ncbi:MAG: hypothetical protein ACLPX5_08845 [Dissulfurispiraceae bacterium]
MSCSLLLKDVFDHLMTMMPIVTPVLVAWILWWQLKINKDKLRLDLYNRRFDIYSKTLDFYQALLRFDPSVAKEQFNTLQKAFIKASRESQFLFDKESNVFAILEQIHSKSFKILGAKELLRELAGVDQDMFLKIEEERMEALRWITEDTIPRLEKEMARYLNFHSGFIRRLIRIAFLGAKRCWIWGKGASVILKEKVYPKG